jgi:hypothetical protein
MKKWFASRDWHTWSGVILSLPLLLVGLTAVFIAHGKQLGFKEIEVAGLSWLPGYEEKMKRPELRALLPVADGQLVAAKLGVWHVAAGGSKLVPGLEKVEGRAFLAHPQGHLLAAKEGLWRETQGAWQQVAKGEFWNVAASPDGSLIALGKEGRLLDSRDGGQSWTEQGERHSLLASLPMEAEPMTLNKLVMDIHTGKAFLGKTYEWLWIDLLGAIMVLLGLTGIYMWQRGQRRRADIAA